MTRSDPAAAELAAVDVGGMTRSSFILRGTLAACTLYGGGLVGPFVGRALAQGGGGDVEILNFALTLEHLEAAFYARALDEVDGLDQEVRDLVQRIGDHEAQHVVALREKIEDLGGTPAERPRVDFGRAFRSQEAFLRLAAKLEATGVGAYNGAVPMLESKEVLAAVARIMHVEGRHLALINLSGGARLNPGGAFSEPLEKERVLEGIKRFLKA